MWTCTPPTLYPGPGFRSWALGGGEREWGAMGDLASSEVTRIATRSDVLQHTTGIPGMMGRTEMVGRPADWTPHPSRAGR